MYIIAFGPAYKLDVGALQRTPNPDAGCQGLKVETFIQSHFLYVPRKDGVAI
jgi:hypothetical protein